MAHYPACISALIKNTFPGVGRAGLMLAGVSLSISTMASGWDCRVSTDGSSWDCYKDGHLVMQPMPQAATAASASELPDKNQTVDVPASSDMQSAETAIGTAAVVPAADAANDISEYAVSAVSDIPAKQPAQHAEKAVEQAEAMYRESVTGKSVAETPPLPASQASMTAMEPAIVKQGESPAPKKAEPAASLPAANAYRQPALCQQRPRQIKRASTDNVSTEMPVIVDADDAALDENTGIADFRGDVLLKRGDQTILSDSLQYNSNTADVLAEGNLQYERPDLNFVASSASMNLDTEAGQVRQVNYRIPANNARGKAEQLDLQGNGVSVYKNASYTTCAPGSDDWSFNAEQVELDQNTGVGTASNMKLYFMDTPILYLPWATFPLDDRRKSGFLPPTIGTSDSTGADISIPYYFNLAPNYDATFTPRIMSKRGLLLGGDLRYLDEINSTEFAAELLPEDNEYTNNDSRGSASLQHTSQFNRRFSGLLDLNYVSDKDYLEDLGDSLAVTSTRYLERNALLNYNGDYFRVSAQLQEYQNVDNTITDKDLYPYKKLPQIRLTASKDISDTNLTADLAAEYTFFDHDSDNMPKTRRFDFMPSLAYDWRRSWGFIKPRASARFTSYDLDDYSVSSIDRTTTTFSLDGGLIFDRETAWFGKQASQTLEPRFFYVYTPDEDQSDIPLFDTTAYTFNSSTLFRENRFTGADRVADANQLTLAVTSRLLSEQTGKEFLTATLGQIFYFDDRSVSLDYLSPDPELEQDTSPYIAMLSSNPSENWLIEGGLQWDDNPRDAEKSSFRIKYEDDQRHLFSARYRYDKTVSPALESIKLSAYWPVAFNTRLVAHSYYSLQDDRAIESVAGIEHGSSCCWRIRALARDYQVNEDQDSNLAFFLQLELSGFGRLGDDIDSFLEKTIDGFVREEF